MMHKEEIAQHSVEDSLSETFYAVLVLFIEQREGLSDDYEFSWRDKDIAYVRAALFFLNKQHRKEFFRRFADFQITKILAEHSVGNC